MEKNNVEKFTKKELEIVQRALTAVQEGRGITVTTETESTKDNKYLRYQQGVAFTEAQYTRIKEYAKKHNYNFSQTIRIGITYFLDNVENKDIA